MRIASCVTLLASTFLTVCAASPALAKERCDMVPGLEVSVSRPTYRLTAKLTVNGKSVAVEVAATAAEVVQAVLPEWSITDAWGKTESAVSEFLSDSDLALASIPSVLIPPTGTLHVTLMKRNGFLRTPGGVAIALNLFPLESCGFSGLVKVVAVIVDGAGRHVEILDVPAKSTAAATK